MRDGRARGFRAFVLRILGSIAGWIACIIVILIVLAVLLFIALATVYVLGTQTQYLMP